MNKKSRLMLLFLSILSLIISIKLFWNKAIFVDQYNLSPVEVNLSEFWLVMEWINLFILAIIVLTLGISLRKKG